MALFHTTVLDNQIKALDTIGTASGAICTFDTDRAERLVSCKVEVTGGVSDINIFNILPNAFDNANVTAGYYLNSDGTTTTNAGWAISDYMPITSLFGYTGLTGVGGAPYSCYYDENKNYISGWKQATGENVVNNAPNNAKYVRMSMTQTDATNNVLKFYPYYDKHTVSIGTSISDGEFDVINGKLTDNSTTPPTISQLDSVDLNAIIGNNNIYADTGDITDLKFVLSVGQAIS